MANIKLLKIYGNINDYDFICVGGYMGIISSILGDRNTGDYNLRKKDYHSAIKYYDKALQKDPKDYRALRGKAYALKGLYKFEEAYEHFNQVLDINKIDPGAKKVK